MRSDENGQGGKARALVMHPLLVPRRQTELWLLSGQLRVYDVISHVILQSYRQGISMPNTYRFNCIRRIDNKYPG